MKIGIITQRIGRNYGGTMQNYALQKVLKDMGHEPVTMMLARPKVSFVRWLAHYALYKMLCLCGKDAFLFLSDKNINYIYHNTQKFVDEKITIQVLSEKEFAYFVIKNNLDAIIVGSDQVWRPRYNDSLDICYLGFTEQMSLKRIAYAASFGVDTWEYSAEETERCKTLVKSFDGVSVREASAVGLCKSHFGIEAELVLDPTLLLSKSDYKRLLNRDAYYWGKFLFAYLLDDNREKRNIVDSIAKEKGLTVIYFMPNAKMNSLKSELELPRAAFRPIDEWIAGFNECDYVVCDSFHGSVFSIIFNKPFTVISNSERGNTRFNSLLKIFGLEDRMYNEDNYNFHSKINWDFVNSILEINKMKSLTFLKSKLCKK